MKNVFSSVQFILATIHDYEIQHKRNYYMAREPRRNPEAYRTWTALYMKNMKQKELTWNNGLHRLHNYHQT